MIGARSTKPVITEDGTAVGYLHDAGSGRLILTGASGDELTREAR
ncbi:hypothetical protein [Brachybacterium equifaecis]|nr:hypothetical protein [Brachybacterium equifaecis]